MHFKCTFVAYLIKDKDFIKMIIQKQVKVLTAGNENADKCLIVLHGYGQLAQYFIRKFEVLYPDYFIIAPEGTHRFYLEGFSGRVGASWMTKEQREWDIQDNMSYIQQVATTYAKDKKISILGFSQGGATAARFVAKTDLIIEKLVLWASVLPHDIILEDFYRMIGLEKYFVLGLQDPFFAENKAIEALNFHIEKGFKTYTFEGLHHIDSATLQIIFSK